MLVREGIAARAAARGEAEVGRAAARLPLRLRADGVGVRTGMLRRLAASRLFALGDRAGVLGAAQRRSGRLFRLDIRQRVIVKALVSRHLGAGAGRGAALARHIAYLARSGAGANGARPDFFDREHECSETGAGAVGWSEDRHHFRFIISPEHGDRISDFSGYVRAVMQRVAADLGEPALQLLATAHFDTDQPHAHLLVRGRRQDGRDLVIPRDYIGYGFRARAQEVAQERLGDLTRAEAERRIWRETQADRFTGFDSRLLNACDGQGMVEDGSGRAGAWPALIRGRLAHLERLGLAVRIGLQYRLATDLESRLRTLQLRKDIIRTLNQRRLEGGKTVLQLGAKQVRGTVVQSGFHDEIGARPYLIVRDGHGVEQYTPLVLGQAVPEPGRTITLSMTERGAAVIDGLGRDGPGS